MSMFATLRPVLALFWSGDRRMLVYGALLSLATALAGIALLGLSGWFITATAIAGATLATALSFDVFMPSAGIRLLALTRTAVRYGERLTTHDGTLRILAALRERLFRSWAKADAAHALTARPSRLLFRLTLDIDALDSLYLRVVVPLLAAVGSALAVAVALAFLHPLLALGAFFVLAVAGVGLPFAAARKANASARRRAHALEALRSRAIDLAKGQTDLLMTGRLAAQMDAIEAADERLAEADRRLNRIESNIGAGLGVAGTGLLAVMLVAVAYLVERGDIGAPLATFAVLLALASIEPFGALRRGAVELGRTLLAAQRLGPRLAAPAAMRALVHAPQGRVALRLEAASVIRPGADTAVLRDIDLIVRPGERIAVVGASGAGKSTLLSLVAGETQPACGQVEAMPSSMLTQRTELFNDTLRGNLALAGPGTGDHEMVAALEAAGLGDFLAGLPQGLDSLLGEAGAGVSGGEARRLALARLLLHGAPVWLLDEPTEGLDGPTARDVLSRVGARGAGHTLVIATHRRREAELADRIVLLRGGGVACDTRRGEDAFVTIINGLRPD